MIEKSVISLYPKGKDRGSFLKRNNLIFIYFNYGNQRFSRQVWGT